MHKPALTILVMPRFAPDIRDGMIKRAGAFFIEADVPIDNCYHAVTKTKDEVSQLNRKLGQRTVELAAANRELKKEIVQRQVAEDALKKSQEHYSKLLEQSLQMQHQMRHLSHQLLQAQEEERKVISRELHDQIAQILTGIIFQLTNLESEARINPKGLEKRISRTQRLVEKSVNIVHQFARDLRPTVLDDLGLIPGLQTLMKDFRKRTGIQIRCTTFAGVELLNSASRMVLYRVAQSALANVAKHAKASRVKVSIRKFQDAVRMEIQDNGEGFEVEGVFFAKHPQRLGLLGMRERVEMVGGIFSVESALAKGTTIRAQIPLGKNKSA